jgi:hypothetical protein
MVVKFYENSQITALNTGKSFCEVPSWKDPAVFLGFLKYNQDRRISGSVCFFQIPRSDGYEHDQRTAQQCTKRESDFWCEEDQVDESCLSFY